jgi:hypothetical protein
MAFTTAVIRDIVKVAKANKIGAAELLAVVEVESSGQPFEQDGVTPRFLYERHVMYRELKKRRGLARAEAAVREGLARTAWNKGVQYKDQATSPARLALMKRAKAFDEECACRSASWGLGQTMGFHAESQGHKDAVAFVAWMTRGGVAAQIQAMVKEIKKSGLVDKINSHDWPGFAYRYNGSGYAQNQYDKRMAAAYERWRVKLPKMNLDAPVRPQPDPAPRPDINPPPPDIEPVPTPAPKPGWWSNIWSKIGAAIGTATGLGGITWLTDWQIAAMFFGFLLIVGAVALAVFFWIWDAEDIRRWSSKQGGEE